MKKRVLSLLLTLLMLVSATPVLLLSASAADTEASYDYSSLYVADGAILMMDFFHTNSIWSPDGIAEEDALPIAPIFGEDYADIDDRMNFWIADKDGNVVSAADMLLADARAELIRLRISDPQNQKGYAIKRAYDPDYEDEVVINVTDRIQFWATSSVGDLKDEDGNVIYFDSIEEAVAAAAKKTAQTGVVYEVKADKTAVWTPGYKPILSGYESAVKAWLKKATFLGNAPSWGAPKPAYAVGQGHRDATGEYGYASFDLVPGALQLNAYSHNDAYIGLGADGYSNETTVTAQYVMLPGYTFGPKMLMLRGVQLSTDAIYSEEGNLLLFKGITKYNEVSAKDFPAYGADGAVTVPLDNETPMDITFAVTHAPTAKDKDGKALTGSAELWYNGEPLLDTDIAYTSDMTSGHRLSLLNFGGNYSSSFFAIRLYNRALTADEMTLNHFADIAKWYKLDIGALVSLTNDKKLAIAKEFADDVIGGGLSEREALAAKLQEIVAEIVYGSLSEGIAQPTAACLAFTQLAKELSLNIAGILSLDAIDRETVYAVVNAMPAAQKTNRSMVQGTVDQAIDAILEEKYGAYLPEEAPDYKELYARQDQLVTWVDFYDSTSADGPLYMDYSYPEETWHLAHQVKKGKEYIWNPDKKRTPQISGEQAARDKYFYRGGDALRFGDIPDANWGHSNIRTWGDGRLECGHNNVLRLSSPNRQGSLTYQIVMDYTGQPNFQLDTFRVNFPKLSTGVNRTGQISSYSYYTYSGELGPTEDKVYQVTNPGPKIKFSTSLDVTLTVDRTMGVDAPRYYLLEYATNDAGDIKYQNSRVTGMSSVRADNYVYRTEIGGKVYYIAKTVSAAAATYGSYIVALTEDEEGKAHYITAEENGTTYYAFYAIVDGAVVETPIAYPNAVFTATATAAGTALKGPCYVNPPRQVSKDTEGDVVEVYDDGTMNLAGYLNGTKVLDASGLAVNGGDTGWVGNGSDPTFYAIRTYACILTEAEILQNHFADLAGYYGLDLTKYNYLTDAQKAVLFEAMKACELGGDRAAAIALYTSAIDDILYDFGSETEAAVNFGVLCRTYALDIRALIPLSDFSRARVLEAFASYSTTDTHSQPVLQKALADAIALQYRDHYAKAVGHGAIGFAGWQLHLEGDLGLRALFATDLDIIRDLSVRGTTVKTGLLMAEDGDAYTNDDLKALVDTATGEIDLDAIEADPAITLVKGYWEDAAADGTFVKNGDLYFTKDVIVEDDSAAYEVSYVYVGFAITEDENGEITVFFVDTTRGTTNPGTAQSLLDLTEAARIDYGMAYPNIQRVLNEVEGGDPYISIFAGSAAISELRFVMAADGATMTTVQDLLNDRIAVTLSTVPAANAELSKGGYLLVSSKNTPGCYVNNYGEGFYGITAQNGNLYLWYNSGTSVADVLAFFCEIVNSYADQQEDVVFESGKDYVRRIQK